MYILVKSDNDGKVLILGNEHGDFCVHRSCKHMVHIIIGNTKFIKESPSDSLNSSALYMEKLPVCNRH